MKQTAVEWLFEQVCNLDWKNIVGEEKLKLFEEAKEMEKQQSKEYAEFAVLCDRENLKILEFDGFINLSQQDKP